MRKHGWDGGIVPAAAAPANDKSSRRTVQSVERSVQLLEIIADHGGEAGLSDLANFSELPMPTVYRLLLTLRGCGLVRQTSKRRYGLGMRLIRLGEIATAHIGVEVDPHLAKLRDATSETCNFAALEGGELVYIAQAPSRHAMRMFTEVGRRVAAHTTAAGKALLAGLPPEEVRRRVMSVGMPTFTDRTVTDMDALLRQLQRVRRLGYAVDEGEQEVGVRCVGVAIPTADSAFYAISVSGPAARLTPKAVGDFIPLLTATAKSLGEALDEETVYDSSVLSQ